MTRTFVPARPIWCAGCGDFAVQGVLEKAFDRVGIKRHRLLLLAGIGCSGTIQNNTQCYGYHALHGRVLPTAIGAKLANPELTVVAAGGDGDGLAIGMGHLIHAFRSNPSITYILMNNCNYGLTKGQHSPTSPPGYRTNVEQGVDSILLGLGISSTTFLARGFSGQPEQLERLMVAALEHTESGKGFAYIEVLSPCVTYNDTHREWRFRVYDLDQDEKYSHADRAQAFQRVLELNEKGIIPVGLVLKGEHPSLESLVLEAGHTPPALQEIDPSKHLDEYHKLMRSFMG